MIVMKENLFRLAVIAIPLITLFYFINPASTATTLNTTVIWKFENCSFENVDKCAQIVMLFGARSLIIPNNTIDMVPHCDEEKSAVKCVYDWGKTCLKSFSRHLLRTALNGGFKNIRERCAPKGTKWYLKNFKCVNDSLPSCHDCMDLVKNEINLIKFNPNKREWIPTGCCYLDRFRGCFKKAIEPHCNDDGKDFMNWCVTSYFSDIVDLACSRDLTYNGDKCTELISHIKVPANHTEPEPHSLFVPLYKLLLEFGELEGSAFVKEAEKPDV